MEDAQVGLEDRAPQRAWPVRPRTETSKPPELVYGVDDVPPRFVVLFSSLQHVGLVTIFLIYPLLIVKEIGMSTALSANVLALAAISLGIATFLQCLPKGPVGSGFLCPANHTGLYLAPSLAAAKLGGLPLVLGMTIFAGVIEAALSPMLRRLRPFFPAELSGVVVFFVGITVASISFRYLTGVGSDQPVERADLVVAGITLSVTVGLNVWAKGQARLFCALIGMSAGYLAAIVNGQISAADLAAVTELPMLAFPNFDHIGWSFASELTLPFAIAAIAATLKAIGVITMCQRINDAGWVRPEMRSLERGVLADGLGTAVSGLIGSLGLTTSTPCAGMAAATGVASRAIGFATGAFLIVLGFLPTLTGLFVLMPRPVMGASLLFAACFILVNGMQTISSRMLDTRRTLVIGLAMSVGIAVELFPYFASDAPATFQPILSSSLVLGTLTALSLNLLFRLGQRQRVSMTVEATEPDAPVQLTQFFQAQGRSWGARRDVMERVSFGVSQAIETIREVCEALGPIRVDARFDEFNLAVQITYQGTLIELPERRPSDREIMETDTGHLRLAGYMLRRNADRISASRKANACVIQFHFDH